jgi:hypothetical protein
MRRFVLLNTTVLVPKYFVEDEEDFEIEDEDGHYIECIIVIANGGTST